jgi:hypothetical protein
MARKTTNLADLYFGANPVLHITSITYTIPDRDPILSEDLHDDEPEVVDLAAAKEPRSIEVTVSLDSTDTNGQGAMWAANAAKTTIPSVEFYPEGKITGSEKWTGSVFVSGVPKRASDQKNKLLSGTFKLLFAAKPTRGVAA